MMSKSLSGNMMYGMFAHSRFNGDISQWNVFGVVDMTDMFVYSQFMGDVSGWEVTDDVCAGMFYGSLLELKGLLPEWYKAIEENNVLKKNAWKSKKILSRRKTLIQKATRKWTISRFSRENMDSYGK